ncbi:MAG TPA: GTPase [Phycisphaerae bacterium]|nr:GTPase [Phycisphaerae bacterium]
MAAAMNAGVFSVLTPPGRGGIAVVRCLGPAAPETIAACFRSPRAVQSPQMSPSLTGANLREPTPPAPDLPDIGRLAYGHFTDADGRPLDEIILYREAETVFEVNCHGGPAAVEAVCRRLADLGLEQVDPDRLLALEGAEPIERDAERMLREARTPLAGRILLDQLNGALARAIDKILKALAAGCSAEAGKELDALLERWRGCGRLLASPPRVAVAGLPNVGKSTLVNRLVGAERVLVSATPGTTRDYVEADAAIEGLPVVLVDTAGLRETEEHVEREGVARARREMRAAAAVVYLLDAVEGAQPEDEAALEALGDRAVAVWNKADLAPGPLGPPAAVAISALTGDGIEALVGSVLARLGWRPPAAAGDAVPFTAAQAGALERARDALARGDSAAAKERLESLAGGATSAG